jgi:hypothetical protein
MLFKKKYVVQFWFYLIIKFEVNLTHYIGLKIKIKKYIPIKGGNANKKNIHLDIKKMMH